MVTRNVLEDRFKGCMMGLAVGDALGGYFEAQTADWIAKRYPTAQSLIDRPPHDSLSYTDDTQMAIGVAEALIEGLEIREDLLCKAFVSNYVPSRGYGSGARRVLEAMEDGKDYRKVAETHFPGGSYANGAAMRVAPVGLFFHDDLEQTWEQARRSALPTHLHPLGIEGAQLLAVAAALCVRSASFNREEFFHQVHARCRSDDFRVRIEQAARVRSPDDLRALGNGIEAIASVPTAIACFALTPEDYGTVIGRAILLGGDTDTIAAMAGALAGALGGVRALPVHLVNRLEERGSSKGRSYIERLAGRLAESHERRRGKIESGE
jgi:poly(ADP-ribose) glycohydrolase ARH3